MNSAQITPYERLEKENNLLRNEVSLLKEQIDWFKRQIFGKRSEKIVKDLNQQQLYFEGFENLGAKPAEQKKKIASHERRESKRKGEDSILLPERSSC